MDFFSAAAERTKSITLGTGVTAPILRYNPAIVAQAFATLGNLYPGRIFLGLGTGEAMNEVPIGFNWPSFRERLARLEEAIKVIRALWSGEFVSMKGKYYTLDNANLYTKPAVPIPIYVAAHGPKIARIVGKYADGFVTTDKQYPSSDHLISLLSAVEQSALESGKNPNSIYKALEMTCAYGKDDERVTQACKKWGASSLPSFHKKVGLYDPREIEKLGEEVDVKELARTWLISTDPEEHIKRIEHYIRLGFSGIHVINLGPDEEDFIRTYGKSVIPYLKDTYRI